MMDVTTLGVAQSAAMTRASSMQQTLQTQMLKMQAANEQGVASMIEQSVEQQKAPLPPGQGAQVDISA
jgi:hypothetical protein